MPVVNSLSDLKNKLQKLGVEIILFNGLTLTTVKGVYTLGPDELYLDNVEVSKKDLAAYLKLLGGKLED